MAMLSREELIARAEELPEKPVAVEAWWDGDTQGWFVVLVAVYEERGWLRHKYREVMLGSLRGEGGDLRLFNGETPPWPEACLASEAGREIASRLGVPFYFGSPSHPEEDCPRWWERDGAAPCRKCGIPLLQRRECSWRGLCYHCHLEEEREKREAAWTPEQRAGPRCHLCGRPAEAMLGAPPVCLGCHEKYEEYQCSCCGNSVCIQRSRQHTDICSQCELRARIEQLSEADRQALRAAASERTLTALVALKERLGWSIHDIKDALSELGGRGEASDGTDEGRDTES